MEISFSYVQEFNFSTEIIVKESIQELINKYKDLLFIKELPSDDYSVCCELVALDRIGGEQGNGGARVFVSQIIIDKGKTFEQRSKLLLLKVVEKNNKKSKELVDEFDNFRNVEEFFEEKKHLIATPLLAFPAQSDELKNELLKKINSKSQEATVDIKSITSFYLSIAKENKLIELKKSLMHLDKASPRNIPDYKKKYEIAREQVENLTKSISEKALDLQNCWETALLWAVFIDERESIALPQKPLEEFKDILMSTEKTDNEIVSYLDAAYDILSDLHNVDQTANINLYNEFEDYLRDPNDWKNYLFNVIGDEKEFKIHNENLINPLRLLKIISSDPKFTNIEFKLSPIHGDFHPRNIMIGKLVKSYIIDFGWTKLKKPTVIDFVLMETSLKYFYFDWGSVKIEKLIQFEKDLLEPDNYAQNDDGELEIRIDTDEKLLTRMKTLVESIRRKAVPYHITNDGFPNRDEFLIQYLIPLFFVTIGNFKFVRKKVLNYDYLLISSGVLATVIWNELKYETI